MKIIRKKKKLITEMDAVGTLGGDNSTGGAVMNSDSYAPGDNRVPKILGLYSRKGKKKTFEEDFEDTEDPIYVDPGNDPQVKDWFRRMDAAFYIANSKLNDLTKNDWNKISDMVDKENINFYDAIRKYYRKKFGESISLNEVDIYFNNIYAEGNRPLED